LTFLLFLSCLALAAALGLALRRRISPLARLVLCLVAGVWGVLGVLLLGSHHFTGAGINTAVIYHLEYGFSGAGFAEYRREMLALAAALALCLLLAGALYRRLGAASHTSGTWVRLGCSALILLSLALHPASADLGRIYAARWGWSADDSVGPGVRYLDPVLLASDSPPLNLLFVYLESLERTYLDESEFPGLAPNINRLRQEGIDFTDIRQLPGTEFTIAGMVASQCGLPLLSTSDGNSNSSDAEFLPGARCMGDLLAERGFQLSFLGGAPLRFAGKGHFYESHGFHRVLGQEELRAQREPRSESSWGLYDDDLFGLVTDELERLNREGQPYAVFTLTLDTHHPRGHPTPSCAGLPYGDGGDPMLNAVHCSDRLVGELVRSLRSSAMGARLLIVLASDHLAMRNTVTERLEAMQRRNLLVLLPPASAPASQVDRPGSLLDVGATVLAAMGLRNVGLGHGRDLRGPAPTLVENSRDPKAYVESLTPQIAAFWRYPGLESGLGLDPQAGLAQAGTRSMELPVLLHLDDSMRIREAIFDLAEPQRLSGYLSLLPDASRYLLVDRCPAAVDLGIEVGDLEEHCRQACLFAGRVGFQSTVAMPLCEPVALTAGAVRRITDGGNPLAPEAIADWRDRLATVYDSGASRSLSVPAELAGPWQGWQIRSSGFWTGRSLLQPPGGRAEDRFSLEQRALGVFELAYDGVVRQVASLDSCAAGMADSWDQETVTPLAELVEARGQDSALLVVANDSAYCGSSLPLERFFAGTGANLWQELGFRQPYVALLGPGRAAQEWLGSPERSLLVRFDVAEASP
jgi:phosphoglycerol transferase